MPKYTQERGNDTEPWITAIVGSTDQKINTPRYQLNPMTENQTITPQPSAPAEDEINLLDLLIVIAKHKKMIIKMTLGAAVLAVGY